jgi:hypothetical protein
MVLGSSILPTRTIPPFQNRLENDMGVFANVPQDKYDKLSPEDKKLVDEYRNQEYDVDVQTREGGNYNDVVSRDESSSVDSTPKTTAKKATPKNS